MTEIERFADHLVMMDKGAATGVGSLTALPADPALPLAASRDEAVSLDGIASGYDGRYGLLVLRLKGGRLLVSALPIAPGTRQRLPIAASDVSLARRPSLESSILNIPPARILTHTALGIRQITVVLELTANGSGAQILARITRRSWDALRLDDRMDVFAQIKGVSLVSAADDHMADRPLPQSREADDNSTDRTNRAA